MSESTNHDSYCDRIKDFIDKDKFPIAWVIKLDEQFRLEHHQGRRDWSNRAADLKEEFLNGPRSREQHDELQSLRDKLAAKNKPAAKPKPATNASPSSKTTKSRDPRRGALADKQFDGKNLCWPYNTGKCKDQDCARAHKCWHCGEDHPGNSSTCKKKPKGK